MKIKCQIILILVFALSGCNHNSNQNHYQGYVEGENIYLASPYPGNLIETLVTRGQHVKKGDLLFKLDPNPQAFIINESSAILLQAQQIYKDLIKPRRPPEIAALEAKVGQAGAQIALAELRVKRNKELYLKHAIDQDSVDASVEHYQELLFVKTEREASLALAKMSSRENLIKAQHHLIQSLVSKLEEAQWQIKQKSIYAPTDGVIFDTYFRKGEFIDKSRPVASLLAPQNIQVEFFVPEINLAALRVNKKITFDCDGCTKNNQATIQYISPEAEYVPPLVYSRDNRDKLVFRVRATIDDAANFKPGQPVVVAVPNNE